MSELVRIVGFVLAAEGLVFALAPRRIEQAMLLLATLSVENRRLIGLASLALGIALIALVGVYAR